MEALTINKPKSRKQRIILNVSPRKYDFLMELLQYFDFVKIIEEEKERDSRKETKHASKNFNK